MDNFDLQKISEFLPSVDVDIELLSDLYHRVCSLNMRTKNKKSFGSTAKDVREFIKLIDRLKPLLEDRFPASAVFEMLVKQDGFTASDAPDRLAERLDVWGNLKAACDALDKLKEASILTADMLAGKNSTHGRPTNIEHDVILCELYLYLVDVGMKRDKAKTSASYIMRAWGAPAPGRGSENRTATINIHKAIKRGMSTALKRLEYRARQQERAKEK